MHNLYLHADVSIIYECVYVHKINTEIPIRVCCRNVVMQKWIYHSNITSKAEPEI